MATSHRLVQQLLASGAMTDEERRVVDEHLAQCATCRSAAEETDALLATLRHRQPVSISEEELLELRRELRASLRRERVRTFLADRMEAWWSFRPFSMARPFLLGGLGLVVGVAIGFVLFSGRTGDSMLPLQPAAAVAEYEEAPTGIAAVHFLDADPETGMVEFTFQAVRPVRVRGSIRDEEIRRILARALLEEENPGVRIRTVSAIAAAVESSLDPKVKAALIKALREDPNPGVRKEALKALRQGPMDNDVQDALIDVLESDKNEGMRVDAINSLTALGAKHPAVGEKLISVLQRRTEIDDNRYIRLRAEAMLKEVQQR